MFKRIRKLKEGEEEGFAWHRKDQMRRYFDRIEVVPNRAGTGFDIMIRIDGTYAEDMIDQDLLNYHREIWSEE